MKAWLFPFAGAPELIPLMEAVQVQLREVGIELEFEEADLVATVMPRTRERKANWYIRPGVPSKKAVEPQIALFNAGKGTAHWFETDEIYKMWEDLLQMSDPKEADAQLRKIGNYKFENFEIIPLFDVYIEVVVNPKIVAGLAVLRAGTVATSATPVSSVPVSRRSLANKTRGRWVRGRK